MPAKRLKNSHPLQTVTFKISIAGEGNQNTKRKTKSYVLSGFDTDISCG